MKTITTNCLTVLYEVSAIVRMRALRSTKYCYCSSTSPTPVLSYLRRLAEMAGRRQAFQGSPELQRFVLPEVRPTGRQLGVGSYGSVEEVEINGLVCAGKRLHDALVEQGNAGVSSITRKYLQECQVMS